MLPRQDLSLSSPVCTVVVLIDVLYGEVGNIEGVGELRFKGGMNVAQLVPLHVVEEGVTFYFIGAVGVARVSKTVRSVTEEAV